MSCFDRPCRILRTKRLRVVVAMCSILGFGVLGSHLRRAGAAPIVKCEHICGDVAPILDTGCINTGESTSWEKVQVVRYFECEEYSGSTCQEWQITVAYDDIYTESGSCQGEPTESNEDKRYVCAIE